MVVFRMHETAGAIQREVHYGQSEFYTDDSLLDLSQRDCYLVFYPCFHCLTLSLVTAPTDFHNINPKPIPPIWCSGQFGVFEGRRDISHGRTC